MVGKGVSEGQEGCSVPEYDTMCPLREFPCLYSSSRRDAYIPHTERQREASQAHLELEDLETFGGMNLDIGLFRDENEALAALPRLLSLEPKLHHHGTGSGAAAVKTTRNMNMYLLSIVVRQCFKYPPDKVPRA